MSDVEEEYEWVKKHDLSSLNVKFWSKVTQNIFYFFLGSRLKVCSNLHCFLLALAMHKNSLNSVVFFNYVEVEEEQEPEQEEEEEDETEQGEEDGGGIEIRKKKCRLSAKL